MCIVNPQELKGLLESPDAAEVGGAPDLPVVPVPTVVFRRDDRHAMPITR